MWFFFTLTLISIFIKIFIFTKVLENRNSCFINKLVFFITCCALFQSFVEVIGYFFINVFSREVLLIFLKLYYFSLLVFITSLPVIAWRLAGRSINFYLSGLAFVLLNVVLVLISFTDLIINDVIILDYTMTRVPGEWYWVFQVSALLAILFTAVTLITAMKQANNYSIYGRCANMLIAFLPLCAFTFLVVILMHLGYQINAIGFLPLFMSIFLGMIVWNLSVNRPPDFSFLIPGSPKQRLLYKMFNKVCRLESEDRPINPEAYQSLLVQYAVEVCKGNQSAAAKLLNTSPSTVSRMLRKVSKERKT